MVLIYLWLPRDGDDTIVDAYKYSNPQRRLEASGIRVRGRTTQPDVENSPALS